MEFKYSELIFTPFVYNFLFVCFLFSIIYKNIEFPQNIGSLNKNYKLFVFIFALFSIPFFQWYNISFNGGYYPTGVFILDFLCGLLVFILFTRANFLFIKKRKELFLLLCAILSYVLIKSIWTDTTFIMTFP
jgi:hypothetical protein